MKVIRIPMMVKYGTTYHQTFFKVVMDNDIYSRFVNTAAGTLYTWGNYSSPSWIYPRVDTLVNEYLQSAIFSNNYQEYAVLDNILPEPELTQELNMYDSIFNKLGIFNTRINVDQYSIDTTSIKNLSMTRTFPSSGAIRYSFGSIEVDSQARTVKRINARGGTVDENASRINEQSNGMYCNVQVTVLPEDYFVGGVINPAYSETIPAVRLTVSALYNIVQEKFGWVQLQKITTSDTVFRNLFTGETADIDNLYPDYSDFDNPYSKEGNSTEGGNDGTLEPSGLDSIQGASIPGLPTVSACDVGFITMYNPTGAELKALSAFLWSDAFDINTYKKIFSDPMESIIGLAVIPVTPTTAGQKNVMFGTIDSGVSMAYLGSQWVQKDCGWVDIEKFVGCFMDADPYTKIQIFLPAIGFRQLSADDINGGSIHVVYNIDCLTGACAAFIEHSTRGVIYSYNGSMLCNIPLTAINFSGAIQNAVSAVISGVGAIAGMTTGAAPLTAMGAMGLMNSAANTALNSKPSIQRSGNMGGAAGIMGVLTPYVIIERPKMSVPYNVEHYVGQASNINVSLSACSGFTVCEWVHVEGISATSEEVKEIEQLLKEGVYL
jgi:hypothetical protein